ncbi:hypothetical protein AJE_05106 [Alishewanella jeotgali KCTC 22429]|uniref:Uncharacterized protein n=1 Tax=Alishewanella jeotgali KCTC 22429 TaxID=1129374 RepID=H3ZCE8_9ALTE|nr:hypothetical protein AJE_05106 [Alishewanella jeotgali KCTC 22429]
MLSALLFLVVMLLVVASNLLLSQLSYKSAQIAQQQLQQELRALEQHLQQLKTLDANEIKESSFVLPSCPGVYAAWSDAALQCELLVLETSEQSQQPPSITRYNTLLMRKRLRLQEVGP